MEEKSITKKELADELVKYSHEVLFPYMEERLAGKKEFEELKDEFIEFKNEMTGFKDENLTGQDKILKKLDILLDEKDVKDYQEKKQKKILAIHNEALKKNKILTTKDLSEITRLEFF